jgi:hypothetical protein
MLFTPLKQYFGSGFNGSGDPDPGDPTSKEKNAKNTFFQVVGALFG